MSEEEYGPHIPWREHSFLKNPRLDPSVLAKAAVVVVCDKGNNTCADSVKQGSKEKQQVLLWTDQLSDDIIRWVARFDEVLWEHSLKGSKWLRCLQTMSFVELTAACMDGVLLFT